MVVKSFEGLRVIQDIGWYKGWVVTAFIRSCHTRRLVTVTCRSDMSPRQNHQHDTQCNLMLRHVAYNTPLDGTGNELTIKMASQGRPAIGLFTELSQRHVARACHTRGRNVHATFCCRAMFPEFKLISIHATHHCNMSQHQIA